MLLRVSTSIFFLCRDLGYCVVALSLTAKCYETLSLVYQSEAYVVVSPCGCCVVHPSSGLNYIQDLGVVET